MRQSGWRVVVVDDQEPVRDSVCDMLDQLGHTVCASAGTGEEGVDAAAQMHPDIVLMDIQMPGIGGIEAARRIRDLPQPAPVVFLTAFGDEDVAQQAAASGGFGYLVKPFHLRQLGPVMQTAVERFRELQDAQKGGGRLDAARQALEGFDAQIRNAGIDAAVEELLASLGSHLHAEGVAVCLFDPGSRQVSFTASWGLGLPESARQWAAAMAPVGQPCQASAGSLGLDSTTLAAAPLGAPGDSLGLLIAHDAAPRAFSAEDAAILAAYAARLGEALHHLRAQQPMTWRRWRSRQ